MPPQECAQLILKRRRPVVLALLGHTRPHRLAPGCRHAHRGPWCAGAFDTTFGTNGYVLEGFAYDSRAEALVLQDDGKIVVGGWAATGGTPFWRFGLVRFTSSGSLDSTFGSGGKVTHDAFGKAAGDYALALQSDGKIVATGYGFSDIATARYNTDGSLDTTFGNSGGTLFKPAGAAGGYGQAVVVQADGKIVIAGYSYFGAGEEAYVYDLTLLRYEADGTLDQSFGDGGHKLIDTGKDELGYALAQLADGSFVAVGAVAPETNHNTGSGGYDVMLTRFHADSAPGTSTGERVYAVHDGNFNITSIIGKDGTDWEVVERYLFDPYGTRTVLNADWTVNTDGLSDFAFVHGHQGGRHDLAVGLVHFRFRDLDTSLGRWTRQDPLGYQDGMSLNTYGKSNSQRYVDPTGLYVNGGMIGSPDAMLDQYWEWLQERSSWYQGWLPDSWIADGFGDSNASWYQMGAMSGAFDPGGDDDGSNMWVYTCKCGWIDMGHFTASALYASYAMRPFHNSPPFLRSAMAGLVANIVYAGSIGVEIHQMVAKLFGDRGWGTSAWTYEDLPSNWQGAVFGANLPRYGRADQLDRRIPQGIRLGLPLESPALVIGPGDEVCRDHRQLLFTG